MEQPLATVYVNMGDPILRPQIKIYPHTHIPKTIRKFMQRYDLPEPVFQVMLHQIHRQLINNGLFFKDLCPNTSEFSPTPFQPQLAHIHLNDGFNVQNSKNEKRTKARKQDPLYTPFYRLFTNQENVCISSFTDRKQKKKIKKRSKSPLEKKQTSRSAQNKNLKKKNNDNGFRKSDLSPIEKDSKVRQFFKFLARKRQGNLLTFSEVNRMQNKTPRLASTLSKLFKKGKKDWLDQEGFVSQAEKLNLIRHLSHNISKQKVIKTQSCNSP